VGTRHLHRREGGRAGRDAVVDHDHDAVVDGDHRPLTAKRARAAVEFGSLSRFDCGDVIGRHASQAQHVVIQHAHAAFPDRAHRQFRLRRHTEFAHDDDVEWRVERPRHLVGDRDPAARQREHDGPFVAKVQQARREPPAGIGAIAEHHACARYRRAKARPPRLGR
jgi:hypothetical protein